MAASGTTLRAGQVVELEWTEPGDRGLPFRAVRVVPRDHLQRHRAAEGGFARGLTGSSVPVEPLTLRSHRVIPLTRTDVPPDQP